MSLASDSVDETQGSPILPVVVDEEMRQKIAERRAAALQRKKTILKVSGGHDQAGTTTAESATHQDDLHPTSDAQPRSRIDATGASDSVTDTLDPAPPAATDADLASTCVILPKVKAAPRWLHAASSSLAISVAPPADTQSQLESDLFNTTGDDAHVFKSPTAQSSSSTAAIAPVIDVELELPDLFDHCINTGERMGPSDLKSLLEPNLHSLEQIQIRSLEGEVDFVGCLKDTITNHIVITESFAGDGAASHAAAEIFEDCKRLDMEGNVVVYSVWDNNALAHTCLSSHKSESKAIHRFGDVLERCLPDDLVALRAIEKEHLAKYDQYVVELKGDLTTLPSMDMTPDIFTAKTTTLGQEYVEALCCKLAKMHFASHAYCYEHSGDCPVSPRSDPALRNHRQSFSFIFGMGGLPIGLYQSSVHNMKTLIHEPF